MSVSVVNQLSATYRISVEKILKYLYRLQKMNNGRSLVCTMKDVEPATHCVGKIRKEPASFARMNELIV